MPPSPYYDLVGIVDCVVEYHTIRIHMPCFILHVRTTNVNSNSGTRQPAPVHAIRVKLPTVSTAGDTRNKRPISVSAVGTVMARCLVCVADRRWKQ